jgi:ABC-type antimicrobial peptide transport system permease subunit
MTRYSESEIPFMTVGDDGVAGLDYSTGNSTVLTACADSSFLTMFSFPLLRGDASTALSEPLSMVITQRVAQRMFGDKDPMGEMISVFNGAINLKVTGVLADLPDNTCFRFDILVPYRLGQADESWFYPSGNSSYGNCTYVELSPGVDVKTVSASIRDIIAKHTDGQVLTETYLQHISKWRLYSKVEKGVSVGGRIENLRMFSLIALMILVIACINFMNMSTAQASKHAKETGIHKVVGARRSALIIRYLRETTMIAAIAGGCALIIVSIVLPFFNAMVGENFILNPDNSVLWVAYAAFVAVTGLLAGSYPAFYLSSFRPVKVLKGVFRSGRSLVNPRKALIVSQFTIAVILITSTFVIHRQIQFTQARDIGYDKSRLVNIKLPDNGRHTRELIRRELLETGVAESVSINFATMYESESRFTDHLRWRGKDPNSSFAFERNYAQTDWAKTTGVQIIKGRDIDIVAYPNDSTAMLINETAAKIMGFDDPVGEIVYEWDTPYHVVGVVKDFVLESPYDPIRPMIIGGPAKGWLNNINVKLSAHGSLSENIGQMEQIFRKYNPGEMCRYWIVDEMYARRFEQEQRMSSMVTWFAALAIFISCMGLFALVAYMAETRRKEIGIRKVLGASVYDIVMLLSKEFLILTLISVAIASPVAWWIMEKWLTGYAYHTNIPWWLFIAVGGVSLCIALATVGFQAIRAATANPVDAIKSE